MAWASQSPDVNQMVWDDGLQSKGKKTNKLSASLENPQDCWKTISGNYLMKLSERRRVQTGVGWNYPHWNTPKRIS